MTRREPSKSPGNCMTREKKLADSHPHQTVEAEGESLKEAREQVKSQLPQGQAILSVHVVSREKSLTIFGVAETIDEAYAQAQDKVPDGMGVVSRRVLSSPSQEIVTVEAFDEQDAEQSAIAQAKKRLWGSLATKSIKLVAAGRKGLRGIRKATPNLYAAEVIQQATVEIGCFNAARIIATIGVPPELTRQEMEVLHDLLAIFSKHKDDGGSATEALQREYVEWWYANLGAVPAITEKLAILCESDGPVLSGEQASQLKYLLVPIADRLKSRTPLSKDEIVAQLDFGHDVTTWHVDEMTVLSVGVYYGEVLFNQCYRDLHAALGG